MALTINTYNPRTQQMVQAYVEMLEYNEQRYYNQYQTTILMGFFVDKNASMGVNAEWFKTVQVINLSFDPTVARTDDGIYQAIINAGENYGFDWSTAEFYVEPVQE